MATRQARRWQIRAWLSCKDKSQSVSREPSLVQVVMQKGLNRCVEMSLGKGAWKCVYRP